MHHLFIINPTAGKRTFPDQISDQLRTLMRERTGSYDILVTSRAQHAEEFVRLAADSRTDPIRIYAFGGDGTLNEVVNGAAGYHHVAVTVCPTGSGNDFLKIFGKARSRFSNIEELLDGEIASFDLIECNERYAINLASVGLDARIGVGMTDFKHLPLVSGNASYTLSLVNNVFKGTHEHFDILLDGEELSGEYTMASVCNGRWYGGSFCPVPSAMPDDGILNFVLVKAVSLPRLASLVKKYASGHGDEFPDLIRIQQGREMTVRTRKPTIAQLDGERMLSDLLSFRLSAKKINFIHPKGITWTPCEI